MDGFLTVILDETCRYWIECRRWHWIRAVRIKRRIDRERGPMVITEPPRKFPLVSEVCIEANVIYERAERPAEENCSTLSFGKVANVVAAGCATVPGRRGRDVERQQERWKCHLLGAAGVRSQGLKKTSHRKLL